MPSAWHPQSRGQRTGVLELFFGSHHHAQRAMRKAKAEILPLHAHHAATNLNFPPKRERVAVKHSREIFAPPHHVGDKSRCELGNTYVNQAPLPHVVFLHDSHSRTTVCPLIYKPYNTVHLFTTINIGHQLRASSPSLLTILHRNCHTSQHEPRRARLLLVRRRGRL